MVFFSASQNSSQPLSTALLCFNQSKRARGTKHWAVQQWIKQTWWLRKAVSLYPVPFRIMQMYIPRINTFVICFSDPGFSVCSCVNLDDPVRCIRSCRPNTGSRASAWSWNRMTEWSKPSAIYGGWVLVRLCILCPHPLYHSKHLIRI